MVVKEGKTDDDLYFADITNIATAHEGYMEMFKARATDLAKVAKNGSEDDKNAAAEYAKKAKDGKEILDAELHEYEDLWNISELKPKDAEALNKRFNKISEKLASVELDENTASLVSNFKFLDQDGKPEPQFVDADGNESDAYTPGAKVIEGSKLHNSIRLAKQKVLLENLGSKEEITPEFLQKEVCETLPGVLYVEHVNSQVLADVKEKPDQFTNPKYLSEFINNLSNTDRPMAVAPKAYEAGVDYMVQANDGYAHCLKNKIGEDKPVVMRVYTPIKDLDKWADFRITDKVDKGKIRKEMALRAGKNFLSGFLVSGAINTVGAMAAANVGLTAATGGLNAMAGAAIGVGIGVAMSIKQIHSWRKQQKQEGKPAGFKAFIKNRKLVMSLATTALGGAALGFAATGNPGIATALGVGALTIGSANGLISGYQDSRKAGLGKVESIGWGGLQALASTMGALTGKSASNWAIDAYNHHNPDNKLFQHEKVTDVDKHTTRTEHVYKEGVSEHAQETLNKWYKGHEDVLQQRVEDIKAYNAEHGTHIDPYRYLMEAHDAGARTLDNNLLHNQGGPDVHSGGNHTVLGDGWSKTTGISQEQVHSLADSVTPDGHVVITDASVEAFNAIDPHVTTYNQVGAVAGAPVQNDGVLQANASQNAEGTFVQDSKNPTHYTTYADGEGVYETKVISVENVTDTKMVPDHGIGAVGMFGIIGNSLRKLAKRPGALLDRIKKVIKPTLPAVLPAKPKEKAKEKPIEVIATPNEKPKKQDKSQEMLMEEYKIVYGIKPDVNGEAFKKYAMRVEEERQAAASDKSMEQFLELRCQNLDKEVLNQIVEDTHVTEVGNISKDGIKTKADYMANANKNTRSSSAAIATARQSLQQSNLTKENYTEKMTLSHFTKYVLHFLKKDKVAADGSRDISLNPEYDKKYKKPESNVVVTDLNAYLIDGKPLEQCQQTVKGNDLIEAKMSGKPIVQTARKEGGR